MLSICITVYNQIDLVKKNLENLLQYKGNDVEIVVSDDCSSDPIYKLVTKFGDSRLRYCKTPKNVGHDMNILYALKNCRGEFAIVLRSRDTLYPEKMHEIMDRITSFSNTAYLLFSAKDETGKNTLLLSDKKYTSGHNAALAHTKLLVHPSGNLYRVRDIDFEKMEKYIKNFFDNVYGFVVHDLIRMDLINKGDFVTSKELVWIYADSHKAIDRAVNSTKNRISVYAPEYELKRFECEFTFIAAEIEKPYQMILLKNVIKRFYKSIVYDFRWINRDVEMQRHYNCKEQYFSAKEERDKFEKCLRKLLLKLEADEQGKLKKFVCKQRILIRLYYPIKRRLLYCLRRSGKFEEMYRYIKRI